VMEIEAPQAVDLILRGFDEMFDPAPPRRARPASVGSE